MVCNLHSSHLIFKISIFVEDFINRSPDLVESASDNGRA